MEKEQPKKRTERKISNFSGILLAITAVSLAINIFLNLPGIIQGFQTQSSHRQILDDLVNELGTYAREATEVDILYFSDTAQYTNTILFINGNLYINDKILYDKEDHNGMRLRALANAGDAKIKLTLQLFNIDNVSLYKREYTLQFPTIKLPHYKISGRVGEDIINPLITYTTKIAESK